MGSVSYFQNRSEYVNFHAKLRKIRGRAPDTGPCADCGGTAAEWSWSWLTRPDQRDFASYEPRCKKCHVAYDKQGAYPRDAQWRANQADSMRGNSYGRANRGQERPLISARLAGNQYGKGKRKPGTARAMKLRWQDPEYRARMTRGKL